MTNLIDMEYSQIFKKVQFIMVIGSTEKSKAKDYNTLKKTEILLMVIFKMVERTAEALSIIQMEVDTMETS
jgi:hypothetical protein